MKHLTDEQFEAILAGEAPETEHLDQCQPCNDQLAERRAVRSKLRSAFGGIQTPEGLAERIRTQISESKKASVAESPAEPPKVFHLRPWLVAMSAAAAMLLIAIPLIMFSLASEPAAAAEAELYRLYQHSISPNTELHAEADATQLSEYFKDELGFAPALPKLGAGMALRGCCVAYFRDKPVGSYVVQTPRGVISVIVVEGSAESVGMKEQLQRGPHTYGAGSFATSNMVTVELGGYTYCAVGEIDHEFLIDLLERLVW